MRLLSFIGPTIGLFLVCLLLGGLEILAYRAVSLETLIWSPIGLALGACIAIGWRCWVGLLLSFFTLYYWQIVRAANAVNVSEAVLVSLLLAGLTLGQAIWTSLLIRRFLPPICSVLSLRQVLRYLLLTGPVYTAMLPWVSVGVLSLYGVHSGNYLDGVMRRWVSDSFSGIVYCTITLSLLGLPASCWSQRRWSVGVPLVVSTLAVFATSVLLAERDKKPAVDKLQEEGRLIQLRTQQQIDDAIEAAMNSWFLIMNHDQDLQSTRARDVIWSHLLSMRLFTRELVNVSYCPIVNEENRDQFEATLSQKAKNAFQITERDASGALVRAKRRPQYAPVTIQGLWTRESVFQGLDLLKDPDRARIIQRAIEQQKPCSTEVVSLITESEPIDVFIVACPLINGYKSRETMPKIAGRDKPDAVLLLFFSLNKVRTLSASLPAGIETILAREDFLPSPAKGSARTELSIQIADQAVPLFVRATPEFMERYQERGAQTVTVVGFGVNILLAFLLLAVTGKTLRKEQELQEQMLVLQQEVTRRGLTEAWLLRSEARLNQAQTIAKLGYWEWDIDQDQVYCSDQFNELIGQTGTSTIHFAELLEHIHPDDRNRFVECIERLESIEAEQSIEVRLNQASGALCWVQCVIVQTGNAIGSTVRGTVQDITPAKLSQLALEERELRLSIALAAAKLGTWDWDFTTNTLKWDTRQEAVFGYEPGTFDGQFTTFLNRVHPDDVPTVQEALSLPINEDSDYQGQFRAMLPGGLVRWIEGYGQVVPDPDAKPKRMIGVNCDITSRKQIELALKASESRLAEAQRIARVGSWEWFPVSGKCNWSDEMFVMLRLDREKTETVAPFGATWVHPDDQLRLISARQQLLTTGKPCMLEFRAVLADRKLVHLILEAHVEQSSERTVERIHGILQDVSDRKLAEEQRRKFGERLQETQKLESLGILAGGVAHDFNNLLTGILGNAMLAREMIPRESELQEYLIPIESAAQHAADLCQQLLAYAGKGSVTRGVISLNSLIQETEELLRLSIPRQVKLNLELAPDLYPIEGDSSQLRQVLLNLVQNAGEAIGNNPGRITVKTALDRRPGEDAAEPAAVMLIVEDTGCGMDDATISRLFEPFFTTKFTGRGLGLSAVHGIVANHQGLWDIRSKVGQGSTFKIRFPLAGAEALVAPLNPKAASLPTQAGLSTHDDNIQRVPHAVVIGLSSTMEAIIRASLQGISLGLVNIPADDAHDPMKLASYLSDQVFLLICDCDVLGQDYLMVGEFLFQVNPRAEMILISAHGSTGLVSMISGHEVHHLQPPIRSGDLSNLLRQLIGADVTELDG
jgi:PAS domain S-box-containing protein